MKKAISIYPILTVNFIGSLGFSLVLPFLVFLVIRYGGNSMVYGILGATYPAFQLVGAPMLGKWSDIYGRRKVLLVSQLGTLFSWLIFLAALYLPVQEIWQIDSSFSGAFVLTLPLLTLFIARAFDGLTGGNISVANAYLSDITEEAERNRNFGKMAVSSNLGFIIGPALAGLLGSTALGETLPVAAAIVISFIATLIILLKLPESKPCQDEIPSDQSVRKVFAQSGPDCYEYTGEKVRLRNALAVPHVPFMLAIYFVVFLGFTVFYTAFPVHAAQSLQWSVFELGLFLSVLSGLMILVQGPVLSRLSERFSEKSLIIAGNFILGTNFILMTSGREVLLYCAALLFAIGNGIMWPSVLSLLSKIAGDKYQGSVQGFAGSFGSLASILGLILGGLIYTKIGGATFYISAAIIYAVFLMSLRLTVLDGKK